MADAASTAICNPVLSQFVRFSHRQREAVNNCRSQSGRMRGMRNLRNMTLVTTCSMAEHQIEIGDPKVDKRKHQISEVRDNRHLYIKKKV